MQYDTVYTCVRMCNVCVLSVYLLLVKHVMFVLLCEGSHNYSVVWLYSNAISHLITQGVVKER